MVRVVQCYEDESGRLHRTAFEAYRADLSIWFTRTGVMNEASAKQLADLIADKPTECHELTKVLCELANARNV